jgi:tetratricopeptide (TPR) repeat protein
LAYLNRGNCLFKKKEFDKAITDYTKVIELDPKNPDTYVNRGDCYYKMKKKEEACKDWNKAKELGDVAVEKLIKKFCK